MLWLSRFKGPYKQKQTHEGMKKGFTIFLSHRGVDLKSGAVSYSIAGVI